MTEHQDIRDIRTILSKRRDILLQPPNAHAMPGTAPIIGVHLRRVVETETRAPDSYNPYNYKGWKYYGQAFAIDRASRGKLSQDQTDWKQDFTAVGGLYVCARDMRDVLSALGNEPEDVGDYLARAPMKRF